MGHDLANTNLKEFVLWLLRLRRRHVITGASMFPLLEAGDEVLFDTRAYQQRMPKVGEIVVAFHPRLAGVKVVKRVTAVYPTHTHTFHLQGDNPAASTDFDHIPADQIIGRVTSRFG